MDITEIKQYLESNKENAEVQTLIDSFKVEKEPTLEVFKEKVQTDPEFKAYLDSVKDQHQSKALETWKANNLEGLVNAQVKELYPEDDPKDLELKKMRKEMDDIKTNANREKMTNLALKKANELSLPTDLVEFLVAGDEAKTLENVERFSNSYSQGIQSTLKQKLEGQGDVVPKGKDMSKVNKEDFANMTYTEKTELYTENKNLYDELTQ